MKSNEMDKIQERNQYNFFKKITIKKMRIKLNKKTNEMTSLYFGNDKITTIVFQCHPRRWYFDVRQSQVHRLLASGYVTLANIFLK